MFIKAQKNLMWLLVTVAVIFYLAVIYDFLGYIGLYAVSKPLEIVLSTIYGSCAVIIGVIFLKHTGRGYVAAGLVFLSFAALAAFHLFGTLILALFP
ncbi:TPA: hypothetical protein DHW62_02200 [candidate division WWE3 bacterium]|uniref:Uncharacterized protein n=1 Tax=candidate division WWE3 bacterium TaxID=2053526 RepID=A0A656PNU5_UNCKA|nr:hypothetical protein P147_WWE3C00001G0763 [candidate division WWE3 bacterium RAAC2_WWE3_1]KKS29173.1 MAG: hypothetical protein UU91_C0008G0037 [candidate division WWE3 bacterium GW2011_GWB1_42_117]KKS54761.1 MAG: hypothetical protein UV21_C0005G0125 [candidate division WWE3 bacterium GW2011_GWD2_42_34]KKT05195.1 MAG: hypothetical protein UV83_C0006G0024 [candidate division WWE3 bacterium GW2011_GWE2_43_18]KKT06462.1 MAG: hypothetical protein UV84_C0007G0024 [candidate division WWE3 bacterium